jgi:hypothetical protein
VPSHSINTLRGKLATSATRRLTEARAAQALKVSETGFFDWALKIPEPKTGTLDFDKFPFQKEMYQESGEREIVVKKATQIGVSAYLIRWSLFYADTRGWSVLYIFPTVKQLYDLSDARVQPLIDNTEYLRGRVPRTRVQNKGLKGVGLGLVYFRGSERKRALDSVDADAIAFDEYDTLTQENLPDAERRVSGSEHGLVRRVGVPSVPDFGVSAGYERSDQRQWLVKCEGCGEWQPIDFWANVDQESMLVVCKDCRKPLDVATGQWVAKHPGRDMRGYHAPRLIVPRIARNENGALASIVAESKKRKPYEVTVFHNKDLAEDYAPAEGRLTLAVIQAAQTAGGGYEMKTAYTGDRLVTMGVDVASTRNLNVRISEHLRDGVKRALYIAEAKSFDEIADLIRRFRVNMAAIDHLPEHRLAMGLAERFAGMVYLVNYSAPTIGPVMTVNEGLRTASVRRTEAIDATFQQMREQRNWLPLNLPWDYAQQMTSLVRHVTVDDTDKVVVSYKATGPHDYAQAEVYDMVAGELWTFRQAVDAEMQSELRPLEDMLEFERSALSDEDVGYSPGPSLHEGFPDEELSEFDDPEVESGSGEW